MAKKIILPTEDDASRISKVVKWVESRNPHNPAQGGGAGKIPPRVNAVVKLNEDLAAGAPDDPQTAEGDFYQVVQPIPEDDPPDLEESGDTITVVNYTVSSFSADDLVHVVRVLGQWHVLGGGGTSLICRPQADVDTGEPMLCDVYEGPIGLETATGDCIIAINMGTLIAEDTRCEAIHYSMRRGGEPHPLTGPEVSGLISSFGTDCVSSTTATQYAEYELFSLEC